MRYVYSILITGYSQIGAGIACINCTVTFSQSEYTENCHHPHFLFTQTPIPVKPSPNSIHPTTLSPYHSDDQHIHTQKSLQGQVAGQGPPRRLYRAGQGIPQPTDEKRTVDYHVSSSFQPPILRTTVENVLYRGAPSGTRREVTARMFSSERKGDIFLGVLRYTLDERKPVFTAVDDCSGRAAELKGSFSATLKDRLVNIGYVVQHVIFYPI